MQPRCSDCYQHVQLQIVLERTVQYTVNTQLILEKGPAAPSEDRMREMVEKMLSVHLHRGFVVDEATVSQTLLTMEIKN